MRNIYLFFILFSYVGFSQLEAGLGLSSVAASDGFTSVAAYAIQADVDYDFLMDSKIRASIGTNFLYRDGVLGVAPGIKGGFDFINVKLNYDLDGIVWYGLGSRIGFGRDKVHGISLSLQGASVDGIGLGWSNISYSYRF